MVDTDTMLPELAQLQQLIDTAPPQLQVELLASIPHMAERLPLYGLQLGNRSASVPAVVLVGGIHGLERIGTQVVLAYLQTLLNRLPWTYACNIRWRIAVFILSRWLTRRVWQMAGGQMAIALI